MFEETHPNEITRLDYLKNLMIILNNCKNIDEITQLVGEKIKEILPDSVIIISISDEEREFCKVNKLFGLEKTIKIVSKYLKYNPYEYKYPIKKQALETSKSTLAESLLNSRKVYMSLVIEVSQE